MAEQAYRAERTEDDSLLTGQYWDADAAGLLAGERLLNDLQGLERQYIETNYRQLEVEQSFSLGQLAPDQLATLRLTGECAFDIPEWFFDLTYPGQYRRRLKAARLTIPCVTGPYVNVGATLRLDSSKIRLQPLVEPTTVPPRHTIAIATSKAQNDAGVFEFSFRDERFMPFEGAGAVSSWQLALPRTLRVFDYATIADVVLHLSYTANFDGLRKESLEREADGIVSQLKSDKSMTRLFSLRQEFPDVFHRLATSTLGTEIGFTIESRHFPFFLAGRPLKTGDANLRVITPLSTLAGAVLVVKEKALSQTSQIRSSAATTGPTHAVVGKGLREFELGSVKKTGGFSGVVPALIGDYTIQLTAAGPFASNAVAAGGGPIVRENLHDILLEIQYSLAP